MKKQFCKAISALLIFTLLLVCVPAANAMEYSDLSFSDEYKSSPYYQRLTEALENSSDKSTMEKTLAVALSQEGYKNYATSGIDVEQARKDGLLWTGTELRMNDNKTGNTEYTRWAQRYVMDRAEETQYLDCDWCAIFVSWCMYQAGYYDKSTLKRYYYSYCAEPRESPDADSWIESFNMEQTACWYTPLSDRKLDQWNWNTYYHRNIDPFEIPYKPGGLVYFSWDASGTWFDHVAIVADYDTETHVLTYINGNSDGQVITRQIDLDVEESFRGTAFAKNSDRIMGYGEYDEIKPLEQKTITTDTPVINWSRDSASGVRIQTDSASKMASVQADGEYLGSIIESNMTLHSGRLAIGKSELIGMDLGEHRLTLVFDDGELEITLNISRTYLVGDADKDGKITILDATAIQRKLSEEDVVPFDAAAADIDGNGLDINDVTNLQRFLAEFEVPYPIGEAASTMQE